jgi:hypothetical protein
MYSNLGNNQSNRAQALKQIHLKNRLVKDTQHSTAIIFGSNQNFSDNLNDQS